MSETLMIILATGIPPAIISIGVVRYLFAKARTLETVKGYKRVKQYYDDSSDSSYCTWKTEYVLPEKKKDSDEQG